MKRAVFFALTVGAIAVSCGDDPPPNDDGPDGGSTGAGLSGNTGEQCADANDCFSEVPNAGDIPGDSICLDRVEGGYCTHECQSDDDCCSVEGVCPENTAHVCGPFESTGLMICFISCEDTDIQGDADEHCATYNRDFHCRSSGGGNMNRKICVPGGGDPCDTADNCTGDLPHCCEDAFGFQRCYDVLGAENRTCLNPP